MQLVLGPIQALKVHLEAPPSALAPIEMMQFIDEFDSAFRTAPNLRQLSLVLGSLISISKAFIPSRTAMAASAAG